MADPLATTHSQGGFSTDGDGSDGVQVYDGVATILGMAPANATTYTLTRDVFLNTGSTINSGIDIITAGFRLFCQGTLINNGTIHWDGNAGVSNTNGAALSGAGGSINTSATVGAAGGAGGVNGGSNGGTQAAASYGGAGPAGGAGASAGGTSGTVVAPTATMGTIRDAPQAILGALITGAGAIQAIFGGGGGGGGGGDATHAGGGGGGGGGIVIVTAGNITGTGSIHARGGAGGNAAASGTNSGGGSGGGGGVVIVVAANVNVTAGNIAGQTIDAAGGALGTHLGASGVDGTAGAAGKVILIPN